MSGNARRWSVVGLIFLGILISYVDRGNASIVAVPLMKEFSLTPAQTGLLLSSFFWTYALFQVPAGYLIDRFGIRTAYAMALFAWSLAGAASGWATSFTHLLLLRLVLGMGEAVSPLASLSYIKQNFEEKQQGLPTSIYIAGLTAGPGVGAFLGGRLLEQFGWREVFLFTGLAGLVWLVPWWLLAPKGKPGAPAAAAAAAATPPAPPLPLGVLLRSPAIWGLWLATFCYSYFWYFVLSWVPPYLVLTHGFTNREMGNTMARALFGMAAVNLASGWLCDTLIRKTGRASMFWRKAFVCTGFVCGGSTLLLLLTAGRGSVVLILAGAMGGAGIGAGTLWALSQMAGPKHLIGRVLGLQNTIAQFAGILAPSLTGFLLGPERNFTVAILIAGLGPLIAAVSILIGVRQREVERLHTALSVEPH